jgi:hypothetical protein
MPLESVLYLGFVIAVLIEFAVVLAYAEWTTRHVVDDTPSRVQSKREAAVDRKETASMRNAA